MTNYDIEQVIGDTQLLSITFKEDNVAIDITGATVYLTVKSKISDDDEDSLFQIIQTSHTDPTNGITELEIEPADTKSLDCGSYYYDIQITTAAGKIYTPLSGKYILNHEITQT